MYLPREQSAMIFDNEYTLLRIAASRLQTRESPRGGLRRGRPL